MAKINKKWGAVIGCWAVALVLIVTGICLGLTVPSRAAEENIIAVSYGEQVNYYNRDNFEGRIEKLINDLGEELSDNSVMIKLLADVKFEGFTYIVDEYTRAGVAVVLDLNGYLLQAEIVEFTINNKASLTIIDSRPQVTRYVCRLGSATDYQYEFYDVLPVGVYGSEIKGGIICGDLSMYIASGFPSADGDNYQGGEIIINGGNLLGTGFVQASSNGKLTGKVTLNGGNLQVYANGEFLGVNFNKPTVFVLVVAENNANDLLEIIEINGGAFYGEIATGSGGEDIEIDIIDDLVNSPLIKFGDGIALDSKDVDGMKVYTVVDATTNEPITPTDPIAEQPANNNSNMIGIIVLGTATVVMLAGVGAAIGITVKRRKRKAA